MIPYGGGNRIRTGDPLLAGQVLYQLSYTPNIYQRLKSDDIKQNAPLRGCIGFIKNE